MKLKQFAWAVLGILLLALDGCGGGGNSNQVSGIEGTGFASGTITGFGSIIVNGIEFSTTGATFTIDGRAGTQADLRVGQVVSVVGPINANRTSGTATAVTFDDNVEGPVASVDVAGGSLVVLGQTVRVDGATTFDDRTPNCRFDVLQPGQVIEVSGFRDSTGVVRATRIECKSPGGEFEVTGVVAALDTNQRRFQLTALTVDYAQAQLQNFPSGQPADGQTVEVKGTVVNSGVLTATRVEFKSQAIPVNNGDRIELEGLITRFASVNDFDVAGQRIATSAGTRFEGCPAPFNPPVNTKVEVEGTLSGGVISAEKVECRVGTDLRVRATVDAVNAAANTLTVLGIQITVSGETRFEDKSGADLSPFRLSDVRVGDFVEVRGGAGAVVNTIAAALVERDDPENRVELRGTAANVAPPDFQILGVAIHTSVGTELELENSTPHPAAAALASEGTHVPSSRELRRRAGDALRVRAPSRPCLALVRLLQVLMSRERDIENDQQLAA